MIYLYLFITFFEIGLFGFGGGYGMLSLIQNEVVYHWHWMNTAQFCRHQSDDTWSGGHQLGHLLRLYSRDECRIQYAHGHLR